MARFPVRLQALNSLHYRAFCLSSVNSELEVATLLKYEDLHHHLAFPKHFIGFSIEIITYFGIFPGPCVDII